MMGVQLSFGNEPIAELEAIADRWKSLEDIYADKIVLPALRMAAVIMLNGIRDDADRKLQRRTGKLQNRFKLRSLTTTSAGKAGVRILNDLYYARFQDQGWKQGKRHSRGGTGMRREIKGKFFMWYGAKRVRDEAMRVASAEIRRRHAEYLESRNAA